MKPHCRRLHTTRQCRASCRAHTDTTLTWRQTTLETFVEGDEPLYEFPPAQSLNRGIIQEQAEVPIRACAHVCGRE